ncbi:hypothetical protein [Jeongeupia chitinilytica]|uniref:Uncharacterized protein n=1 Tax=Jeongeupia chitinilytica TaxID=1041641 RepID=A0ABQ3H053_9NEIS|nr:hypothetical protein [Jeongeupia chitinilytica]GHD63756.1 hypothetical protein GCM10007350_21880 [Jeongeupia chitinilytica]
MHSEALSFNAAVRDAIATCLHCVCWLAQHRFKVLLQGSGSGSEGPWVLIAHSPKCELLKQKHDAEVIGRISNERGPQIQWRAMVNGCAVQWFEKGV